MHEYEMGRNGYIIYTADRQKKTPAQRNQFLVEICSIHTFFRQVRRLGKHLSDAQQQNTQTIPNQTTSHIFYMNLIHWTGYCKINSMDLQIGEMNFIRIAGVVIFRFYGHESDRQTYTMDWTHSDRFMSSKHVR